tara:strand:+ start:1917 stop:3098 length:1182 start_codon:yes stop_codon:yes gene_type:complete
MTESEEMQTEEGHQQSEESDLLSDEGVQELEETLDRLGLGEESLESGNWYNAREAALALVDNPDDPFTAKELAQVLSSIEGSIDKARAHELQHCINVGVDSKNLVDAIFTEPDAWRIISGEDLPSTEEQRHISRGALYAGVLHDLFLTLKGSDLSKVTPVANLDRIARNYKSDSQLPLMIKDTDDDVAGAVLALEYLPPSEARDYAVAMLLAGSDSDVILPVNTKSKPFPFHKVQDAIWYHDGNYPIRGHAESEAIIGDRIKLFEEGKVSIELVEAGVTKILDYTMPDLNWHNRDHTEDREYVGKHIDKKTHTPGLVQKMIDADVYASTIGKFTAQGRSARSLQSPAFWNGVDEMPDVISRLDANPAFRESFGHKIDHLTERYEMAQTIRPRG